MSTNEQRRKDAMNSLEKEIKSRERAEKRKPMTVAAAAAAAIAVIVGGIVYATNQGEDQEDVVASETTNVEEVTQEPLSLQRATPLAKTVECTYEDAGEAAKEVSKPKTSDISTEGTVSVTLETNKGDIPLELDRAVAPCTTNAIEHFVTEGYYDDTVCHRLTNQGIFVLQCGDPSGTGAGGPGFQFANEYPTDENPDAQQPVVYPRGTIAMANAGADTNGSQFFLNYQDTPLPPAYTYFGKINDKGLEVLDEIAAAGIEGGASDGAPAEEVKIEKAVVN